MTYTRKVVMWYAVCVVWSIWRLYIVIIGCFVVVVAVVFWFTLQFFSSECHSSIHRGVIGMKCP